MPKKRHAATADPVNQHHHRLVGLATSSKPTTRGDEIQEDDSSSDVKAPSGLPLEQPGNEGAEDQAGLYAVAAALFVHTAA